MLYSNQFHKVSVNATSHALNGPNYVGPPTTFSAPRNLYEECCYCLHSPNFISDIIGNNSA